MSVLLYSKTNVKSQDDKILALNDLSGVCVSLTWVIPSQNDCGNSGEIYIAIFCAM